MSEEAAVEVSLAQLCGVSTLGKENREWKGPEVGGCLTSWMTSVAGAEA